MKNKIILVGLLSVLGVIPAFGADQGDDFAATFNFLKEQAASFIEFMKNPHALERDTVEDLEIGEFLQWSACRLRIDMAHYKDGLAKKQEIDPLFKTLSANHNLVNYVPKHPQTEGRTLLMQAAYLGELDVVERLLKTGASASLRTTPIGDPQNSSSAWCLVYGKADKELRKSLKGKTRAQREAMIADFDAKANKMYTVLEAAMEKEQKEQDELD